jgi:chaperone required for assembly of F1-ATPase
MRPPLRRRFYRTATVGRAEDGFPLLLDGRPARTPAGGRLSAPAEAVAQAIAAEWEAQADAIDPARMPLTRLANSIIDGVEAKTAEVAEEIAKYLRSDLLFYRALEPAGLVERQARHWDPVIAWAGEGLGAAFLVTQGTVFIEQAPGALLAARAAIPTEPWRLGAVSSMTNLTGSALLALALAAGRLSAEAAWEAAHVDEDWNMEQWGRDALALERREYRWREMRAAAALIELLRPAEPIP